MPKPNKEEVETFLYLKSRLDHKSLKDIRNPPKEPRLEVKKQ